VRHSAFFNLPKIAPYNFLGFVRHFAVLRRLNREVSAIAVIARGLNGDNHVVVFEFKTSLNCLESRLYFLCEGSGYIPSDAYNNPKIF
jgi:hypothetical protein